jgi:HK97 family phage major capsid protein
MPELDEKEKKFLDTVKAEFKSELDNFKKGIVTQEQIEASLTAKFNEMNEASKAELVKTIDAMGLDITGLKEGGQPNKTDWKKGLAQGFQKEGLSKELQKVYQAKAGSVEIFSTKTAATTISTSNLTTDTGGNAILDMLISAAPSIRLRTTFIEQYANTASTNNPAFTYSDVVPKNGDAAFLAEAAGKSIIDLDLKVKAISPKKVAAYEILTEEAVTDIPYMRSVAEGYLLAKTMLKRQNGILFGAGTDEPNGISDIASAFDIATWEGGAVAGANIYDAIIACANQIEVGSSWTDDIEFYPNLCFLNPADWNPIRVKKNATTEQYLFGQASESQYDVKMVDGIAVVKKNSIPQGKIMIGDFTKLNIINYINYSVRVGWINAQFINNLFTLLGETRFYSFVKYYDKRAFIYDDITTVTAAIGTGS